MSKLIFTMLCLSLIQKSFCSENPYFGKGPAVEINNNVTKIVTAQIIAFVHEDERCEFNFDEKKYTYTKYSFPPATTQEYKEI